MLTVMRTLLYSIALFSAALSTNALSQKSAGAQPVFSPTSHLDTDADHFSVTKAKHFRPLLTNYLQRTLNPPTAAHPVSAGSLLSTMGSDQIESIALSSKQLGDTWISRAFIQNQGNNTGIFQLLDHSDAKLNSPFLAPVSTDIAAQFSLDLSQASNLLTELARAFHDEERAQHWLDQMLADRPIREFMKDTHARAHLAIDFDDNEQVNLGRVRIGRPHVLLRIDGVNSLLESYLTHLIKYRGVPFLREEKSELVSYRLPEFIKTATAGILPFIQFDRTNNTATLASTREFLLSSQQKAHDIAEDPSFQSTWKEIPTHGSAMLYISKRALHSTEKLYQRAIDEQWTDNPGFLRNRPIYDQFIKDLNSSETGIAFAITPQPNGQLISLKGPLPSALFTLIFGASQ